MPPPLDGLDLDDGALHTRKAPPPLRAPHGSLDDDRLLTDGEVASLRETSPHKCLHLNRSPAVPREAFPFNPPTHVRLDDRRRSSRVRKRSCRPPRTREGLELRSTTFEPPEAPTTNFAARGRLDFDDGAVCCQKTTAFQEGP